ncbi:hypothetical protein Esi_0102_0029 [Ectocarpus siliculosus]|uniref:Uncharacterized protein n=1 Tax=Ectocarpus siliculosus TaxID=2880 RepID=D7FGV4_ECTSI|nr:hypothetical protein Esi_0102_0029 [Ectocarpus siliculosus]|eukprot:CBJ48943.1 hypothetical protein Esi_0102_0029 [Ectocarpus siliculosus]
MGQRWGVVVAVACSPSRVLLDQPLPVPQPQSGGAASEYVSVARALKVDASLAVAQDLSLGTAVAACMSLLVAAAVAAAGVNGDSGNEQDELAAAGFPKSLLPVDYSKAFSALQDDGDSPLDMVTALAQESLVILERVLTENTYHSESVGSGTPSDGTPSFAMAAPGSSGSAASAVVSGAAALLLRSAEAGGFVTGWPFVSGTSGSEVPSFALVAAALSSFPPRRLASDPSSRDPCAERLPALANSTLASLVRSGFPFNGDAASAPMAAAAAAAAAPPVWAGVPTAAGPIGGGGGGVVRPLADSLSPDDAYHLRQALVAAMSSQNPDEPVGGGGTAVEERRAAALGLLLSAVKEQPALVVVLFWAQPTPPRKAGATPNALSTPSPPTGDGETAAVVGGAALSGALLSVLKALSVELADGQRGLAGGSESLVMALELVLGLWHAEGVGRLGQAVFALATSEEFWVLLTSVLIQDLSWDTRSRHAGERGRRGATPSGGGGAGTRREADGAAVPHASLPRHCPRGNGDAAGKVSGGDGGDGGGGVEGSRAAAKAVEGFIRTNIEEYFGCWTSTYTLFSLDPRLAKTAKKLASDLGISLDDTLAVPTRESGGRAAALRLACEAANRNWSLAEAEAVVMRAFRVFVEVCVLRRQPGYQAAPAPAPPSSSSTQASGNPGGAGGSGGGGGDPGEVSPARTPVVVSRGGVAAGGGGGAGVFGAAGGGGAVVEPDRSDFLGDKRSFSMVKIAAHRLAGEKRKGWAVVNVVAEMCEALVSMLHHQLHEVVQKALEPRRSVVRRRDPGLGRLSRGVRGQMSSDACDVAHQFFRA